MINFIMARKIVGMPILGKESLLNSVFSMVLFRNQEIFCRLSGFFCLSKPIYLLICIMLRCGKNYPPKICFVNKRLGKWIWEKQ